MKRATIFGVFSSSIHAYWNRYVEELGVERLSGYARFVEDSTFEVDGKHYSSDYIVFATGDQPDVPPLPGAESGITHDGFFALG